MARAKAKSTPASSTASKTLADFVSIGPRTCLYSPPQPVPGQLIIICTWLGAAKKHIAKYTKLYQQIAPGSRILLIESNVQILVSSVSGAVLAITSDTTSKVRVS